MLSVTVDSNIYISAFKFGGTPLRLLRLAVEGKLEIAISQPIMDEILRVLREKFGESPERLREGEAWIREFTHLATPSQTLNIIKEDPDDNRILECAAEAGSDVIVSGDKDLHRLKQYGKARVVKVADCIDMVIGKGWRTPKPEIG